MFPLPVPPRIIIFIFLSFAQHSLQAEDCTGPLSPEVVHSTAFNSLFPASSVLILGEEDAKMANGKRNYWAAENGKTTGQGFTIRLDACSRLIAGCQIKNIGKGFTSYGATKHFQISGSTNENGPWETLVEDQLVDTTGGKAASLLNFTFDKPVKIQFLKFDLISYWGSLGGALQYFAAIPATSEPTAETTTDSAIGTTTVEVTSGPTAESTTDSAIGTATVEVTSCEENINTLLNVIIGLATLSGVLLLLLLLAVYLIYKMWSTARNAIKRDFNPVYGIDYEGEEAEN